MKPRNSKYILSFDKVVDKSLRKICITDLEIGTTIDLISLLLEGQRNLTRFRHRYYNGFKCFCFVVGRPTKHNIFFTFLFSSLCTLTPCEYSEYSDNFLVSFLPSSIYRLSRISLFSQFFIHPPCLQTQFPFFWFDRISCMKLKWITVKAKK